MRDNDPRSRRIAVVSEALLNAHLLGDDEDRKLMHALEEDGFGLIQLPPDDVSPHAVEAAIGYAVDQVQDYLKNSYAVLDALGPGGQAAEMFRIQCRNRGIQLSAYRRNPHIRPAAKTPEEA